MTLEHHEDCRKIIEQSLYQRDCNNATNNRQSPELTTMGSGNRPNGTTAWTFFLSVVIAGLSGGRRQRRRIVREEVASLGAVATTRNRGWRERFRGEKMSDLLSRESPGRVS